ncbi:hypothetical protein AALC75_21450 [Lachnospiraceae bacterium 48-42]
MTLIKNKGYTDVLQKKGMRTIHVYGIACYKKSCKIEYRKQQYC